MVVGEVLQAEHAALDPGAAFLLAYLKKMNIIIYLKNLKLLKKKLKIMKTINKITKKKI